MSVERGTGRYRPELETAQNDRIIQAALTMVLACEAHLEPPYDDDIGEAYVALRRSLRLADVILD
jgi:hypothetical protein